MALDFVLGWCAADAEAELGFAQAGMISRSAQMALSLLRMAPEGEARTPAAAKFIDLGYCANRLNLDPQTALAQVLSTS